MIEIINNKKIIPALVESADMIDITTKSDHIRHEIHEHLMNPGLKQMRFDSAVNRHAASKPTKDLFETATRMGVNILFADIGSREPSVLSVSQVTEEATRGLGSFPQIEGVWHQNMDYRDFMIELSHQLENCVASLGKLTVLSGQREPTSTIPVGLVTIVPR